ncbi:MAG TPA: hypothetical protein VH950_11660 [Gaiellaceae bacterium]|jgi:hypothetical protein
MTRATVVAIVGVLLAVPAAEAKFPIRLALAEATPATGDRVAVSVRIPREAAADGAEMRLLAVPPGVFVDEALRFERRFAVRLVRQEGTGVWRGELRFTRAGRWRLIVPNWGAPGYASPPPVVRDVDVDPPGDTVLVLSRRGAGATLSSRDALTLAPVGRTVPVGPGPEVWARSPGGGHLALGSSQSGLTIVDLRRLRVTWRLPRGILARALAWVSPRRLLLVEHGAVLAVDPLAHRIVGRADYEGEVRQVALWQQGIVALASPGTGRVEPARLVVVGPGVTLRSVELPAIRAGVDGGEDNQGRWRSQSPALAVDAAGGRAYVAGGDRVVTVDLSTLAADPDGVVREPQKVASGPTRYAAWLGDGTLAISGYDLDVRRDPQQGDVVDGVPYGLRYLRGGSLRVVDREALQVKAAGGLALVFGNPWWRGAVPGDGLAAYDTAGALRWRALPDAAVESVTVAGGRAYALAQGRWHVVDVRSGRVLSSPPASASLLLLGR